MTVVTDVLMEVVVDGVGASVLVGATVVVGVAVVVGVTVEVTVVGGGGAAVVLGCGPAVCVVGAADSLADADVPTAPLEVTAGLGELPGELPAPVNFTTA